MFNHDYELEKSCHPENFEMDEEITSEEDDEPYDQISQN